ncbi:MULTISPECIES: hypothetical protein [Paenibacillus]|uniref:Phage protein n=1 Tax=Paenibacillus radicis (ex Xue et al. 2023) TaxID=2972489 RepID=A0ABT1YL04_9BACL|nr:hypothetical protein [Paenibacillus radicis (ex Xue et al. 2023)]MCR8633866.1 hypothetical protein [Paenibacillus radicis (ex Xue et al. 2023)]
MRINLKFTNKGQVAIENFNNDELIEIFSRYINTLTKKYAVDITVPAESNQNIAVEGALKILLENVNCDVDTFFKELGRDIKIPLKKRLDGKLDNVFKTEVVK